MKCPSCGADMKGNTVCSSCGKSIEDLSHGIEVEYKDFKVSELLEIRTKDHQPARSEKSEPEKAGERDLADEPRKTGAPRHEETGTAEETGRYRPGIHEGRKFSPFLLALVFFLLALVASAFLLWHLFTR